MSRILFVVFALVFTACSSSENIRITKERGNIIVVSLSSYKTDNGIYPSKLELLVPKYLASIPQPAIKGQFWIYGSVNNGSSYILTFNTGDQHDPTYWFKPDYKDWSADTK